MMEQKLNIIMDSLAKIAEIEFNEETELMYEKWSKELGVAFKGAMLSMVGSVEMLQSDCKKGTSYIEAALLMVMTNLDDASSEDNKKLNELIKASVAWKRRQLAEVK